jgi:hypothetical protein
MAASFFTYPAASAAANPSQRRLTAPAALPAIRKSSRQLPSVLSFRRTNAVLQPLRVAGAGPQVRSLDSVLTVVSYQIWILYTIRREFTSPVLLSCLRE